MQIIRLLPILFLLLCCSSCANSQSNNISTTEKTENSAVIYPDWDVLDIEGICSLQFPNTMELRDLSTVQGKFLNNIVRKWSVKLGEMSSEATYTLQPKGINSSDPEIVGEATSKYSRIIIAIINFSGIDQDVVASMTESDIAEINDMWKKELSDLMPTATWYKLKREVINGKYALVSRYDRYGRAGKVCVAEYKFFLSDKLVRITLSYRDSEADIWKADIEKVPATIKIN